MADSLHTTLATFRDSILQSIARLEFQLRDSSSVITPTVQSDSSKEFDDRLMIIERLIDDDHRKMNQLYSNQEKKYNEVIQSLLSRIESLEHTLSSTQTKQTSESVEEILTIEEPTTSRNIVIPSIRSTPALAAAVAAANPVPITLDSASDSVSEESGEVVEEETESDSEDSGPSLKKVIIKGVSYYMDESNTVYQETEDGYEEVGTYNPKLDRIDVTEDETEEQVEEEEANEEEEEAIETEEFVYKGNTYQRDAEGNVYDDEGDVIGFWNGKKIVAPKVA